jgi:4-amino-4-deoxy-L-arabinose transferase-like glycosyltransferase
MSLTAVARPSLAASVRWKAAARAVAPFALILAWTILVRLPFVLESDKDEYFFSVIATEWARGGLPYVATFDIKPPGLFFVYLVGQAVFGASLATVKGMEILAVAIAAGGLFAIMRRYASERLAIWTAVLFPVCTLTMGGAIAVNILLQLPFFVLAFAAALAATRDGATDSVQLRYALLAGLAIGAAGMLKQTAVFEAVAIFLVLGVSGERKSTVRRLLGFVAGAIAPALAFAGYFAAAGHFSEMFNAVVTLALARTDDDVLALYGPDLAYNFTLWGTFANTLICSAPLVFLWGGAALLVPRLPHVARTVQSRILGVAATWLLASFAGAMAGRGLCTYYLLPVVPPLLILAGAYFCHGLDLADRFPVRAFALTAAATIAAIAFVDRENLFTPNAFLAGDYDATRELGTNIRALGPSEDDRLLVLNRGFALYGETGLLPPTPYFHATHLLGAFHTPVADPLGVALAANPRFIVIADPGVWHITERRSQIDRALAYVAAHYRVAAQVNGAKDSFTLYEFRG